MAMIGTFKLNPFKNKGDKAYISLNFGSLFGFCESLYPSNFEQTSSHEFMYLFLF